MTMSDDSRPGRILIGLVMILIAVVLWDMADIHYSRVAEHAAQNAVIADRARERLELDKVAEDAKEAREEQRKERNEALTGIRVQIDAGFDRVQRNQEKLERNQQRLMHDIAELQAHHARP